MFLLRKNNVVSVIFDAAYNCIIVHNVLEVSEAKTIIIKDIFCLKCDLLQKAIFLRILVRIGHFQ